MRRFITDLILEMSYFVLCQGLMFRHDKINDDWGYF